MGKVMSLPVLLREIRRHWYSMFLSVEAFFQGKSTVEKEISILEDPKHGAPARQFLTPDHKKENS